MSPHYCNHGVTAGVTWPTQRCTFEFGDYQIVAFPSSPEFDSSLHIDYSRSRLSAVEGMSILSQVLSIATWLDDAFAILHPGGAGSTEPVRPRRETYSGSVSGLDVWSNSWEPIDDPVVRRALGLYREAKNMYRFHSVPYSVLGYYKILETTFSGPKRAQFLEAELAGMLSRGEVMDFWLREVDLGSSPRPEELASFLYQEGRQAVAHAGGTQGTAIDPDDIAHVRRLSVAAKMLAPLARMYINQELQVGGNPWDQSDTSVNY